MTKRVSMGPGIFTAPTQWLEIGDSHCENMKKPATLNTSFDPNMLLSV